MKKVVIFTLLAIFGLGQASFLNAQENAYTKKLHKEQKKEYKRKLKEFKKENYKVFGTSHSIEVALLTHYDRLAQEGVTELFSSTKSTSKNIGKEKLFMAALSDYAKLCGSNLKGRMVEDLGSNLSTEELAEFEHFYAAYENNVSQEIKGEVQNSFIVYRTIKEDGKEIYDFQAFYLVDESAATKARIRAFENAARESAVAQRYAEQISKFIDEGVNKE